MWSWGRLETHMLWLSRLTLLRLVEVVVPLMTTLDPLLPDEAVEENQNCHGYKPRDSYRGCDRQHGGTHAARVVLAWCLVVHICSLKVVIRRERFSQNLSHCVVFDKLELFFLIVS